MAERVTRANVEAAFKLFAKEVPAPEGERWLLEKTFHGFSLWTVKIDGTGGYHEAIPVGGGNLGKAREAVRVLHAMRRTAEYLRRRQEG